ncbi:MAG: hypothetical protein IKW97_01180 [Muribaculaceae bacterium]|nr:hypothetical protein [Muribaculaceae bacterium]
MMKKFIYMAAFLLLAAMTLTACGDDEPKEKTTATATYNMTFSQDLLDACSLILITYKAENGRNVMKAIDQTWWSMTVTSDKFPAEFGVMYKFSTKADAELIKEKYDLSCTMTFSVKTNKGASYSNSVTIIDSKGVSKDKVVSTLNRYDGKSTGFRVTKDGIVSQANGLNYD